MKSVVVTGVSSGIGLGATRVLVHEGYRVFGSVRRQADAERLRQELGERFVPLLFDVTDGEAVKAGAEQVRGALGGEPLFGLVNNAGVAATGPVLELPLDDLRRQLEVNLVGVVACLQAFAPMLWQGVAAGEKPGRIVNVTSVGGKTALPFLSPYVASKFALEGVSESLRREMRLFGVEVIVIAPGFVSTEMTVKGAETDLTPYDGTPYAPALAKIRSFMTPGERSSLTPERLGRAILHALTTPRPAVRYTVSPNPLQTFLIEHLPKRMIDSMIGGQLGLRPS
ncbi:MAG TPA: SDR family oxidoreductase [Caulobacteraceae bacterium]|nr:SDR family oxidoreductase [Caulobacteraceae bacterium]